MPVHASFDYAVLPQQEIRLTIEDDLGGNEGATIAIWTDTTVVVLQASFALKRPTVALGLGSEVIGRSLWVNTVVARRNAAVGWDVSDRLTGGPDALTQEHDGNFAESDVDTECIRRIRFVDVRTGDTR